MKRAGGRGRHGRLLVGLALAAALPCGCGIEDIPVLNPPQFFDANDSFDYFAIRITESNDEGNLPEDKADFLGVEVYYKFYGYGSLGSIQSGLATHSEVVNAGFRRLASTADRESLVEYPLIKVPEADRGERATITLDFSPLQQYPTPGQPFLFAVPDTTGLTIADTEFRRGVVYPVDDTFKKFYSDDDDGFLPADADISTLGLAANTDHEVYIALYALSYGIDNQRFTTLYSRAVFLTSIQVTIHVTS